MRMVAVTVLCTLMMLVGLIGIVLPILPGLLLVWGGVAVWAFAESSTTGWVLLGACSAIIGCGVLLEFLLPGKRMKAAGVATSTLLVAVIVGVICAILIPVVGFFIGFPLGIYLVQRTRRRDHRDAWDATKHALKAIGLNILIELLTALAVIALWAGTLTLSG
ncbi:DUF456 domain-containing protein [Ornithinimicrobium sp. INDO-MA30-4]|uniref:DUF456 domain-containing protein n=1 Tax=Ornithinimicrobium sp. INDO-MA30-4 TaxID=2908651 RepID=UPI001F2A2644|nr:DUF456 domain-containing protein [Ornithinimicrobium sp. INDO-MA30-4]UJH71291.1 DUF456 domain-containing protein [Ornithinimicrobium sp. INDO-MA30-4]